MYLKIGTHRKGTISNSLVFMNHRKAKMYDYIIISESWKKYESYNICVAQTFDRKFWRMNAQNNFGRENIGGLVTLHVAL